MRFKLTLTCSPKQLLPLNYQYELASWVYHTIHRSDSGFAAWLHSQGYSTGNKSFKLFTFSNLELPKFKLQGDRLLLLGDSLSVQLSFALEASAEHFIKGIFQSQRLTLGDKQSRVSMEVQQIEAVALPIFRSGEPACFRTLSPLCVSSSRLQNGRSMPLYHSPADAGYGSMLLQNLLQKHVAAYPHQQQKSLLLADAQNFSFKLLSESKSRLVTIKANMPQETKVRGYLFNFELQAQEALLQLGYAAGFGEKNSLGFGCVEVMG